MWRAVVTIWYILAALVAPKLCCCLTHPTAPRGVAAAPAPTATRAVGASRLFVPEREAEALEGSDGGRAGRGRADSSHFTYRFAFIFAAASRSFFSSSGVSFGGSSLMVSLSILPVNLNGIW